MWVCEGGFEGEVRITIETRKSTLDCQCGAKQALYCVLKRKSITLSFLTPHYMKGFYICEKGHIVNWRDAGRWE